jgi:opacity protein-like surface antigen
MRVLTSLLLGVLLLALPATAHALRFTGVDGMMQSVKVEGQSGVSGMALRTRIESDDLPVGISLLPAIEYWRDSDRIEDFDIRAVQSDLTFGVDGRYDFGGDAVRPYLGAGFGVHIINQDFEAPRQDIDWSEDHTRFGPQFFLGVQLAPAGWLQSFVEAKYAVVSDFNQFKLNWGFGVNF